MKNVNTSRLGFTLIELLVVVLIIGILASVALPQYNKAVRKARLSEVASTFNSISKGIDMWLLENGGYPAIFTTLSGNGTGSNYAKLDTQQSCTKENSGTCYTKVGSWAYYCNSTHCGISLDTYVNADGTSGNKWLPGSNIVSWYKHNTNGVWGLYAPDLGDSMKPEICRWWKDLYGSQRVFGGYGDTLSTECDAY